MIKQIDCNIFESGADYILHQVNCQGVMGSGIAKQVRERYPWVYAFYKELCEMMDGKVLGFAQHIYIDETRAIVNIFGQRFYGYDNKCYTDYGAIENALIGLRSRLRGQTIAIPYLMGCCRGGGDWDAVYSIIEKVFGDYPADVLICKYNGD